jgi:hypothetical protein
MLQPELAPQILSEDEGDLYPKVPNMSDTESEDADDEDDDMGLGNPKGNLPHQSRNGWKVYQRINNNGQPLVRADVMPKVLYEIRHPWFLKDSVSLTYSVATLCLLDIGSLLDPSSP